MTSQQLTFGVELEFALAYIPNCDPDPPGFEEKRVIRFLPQRRDQRWMGSSPEEPTTFTAQRHVAETMIRAGHDVKYDQHFQGDITKWEAGSDASVCGPCNDPIYKYFGLEVKSPAMLFCLESLRAIEHVCAVLTNTIVSI